MRRYPYRTLRGRSPQRTAFTLIELLIVIAIMAILTSILFPVFARAREKARQATCASNMKNLGLSFMQYTQDYDERLPLIGYPTPNPPYYYDNWHDLIDPYCKNVQICICPTSDLPISDSNGKPSTDFGYNVFYLNKVKLDFSNYATAVGVKVSAIQTPAETVMLMDAQASMPSYCGPDGKYLLPPSQPNTSCWGRPSALHTSGVNILWLDGHVKLLRLENFYSGQTPPDRYFIL